MYALRPFCTAAGGRGGGDTGFVQNNRELSGHGGIHNGALDDTLLVSSEDPGTALLTVYI